MLLSKYKNIQNFAQWLFCVSQVFRRRETHDSVHDDPAVVILVVLGDFRHRDDLRAGNSAAVSRQRRESVRIFGVLHAFVVPIL